MKIAMIGAGYVGLTSGTLLSDRGNEVTCVDNNPDVVGRLRKGEVHFYEPGLEQIVERNVASGNLRFTTDLAEAVRGADVTFLCVPTPPGDGGAFNLKYVTSAARDVGRALRGTKDFRVVVGKSTVSQGTSHLIEDSISEGLGGEEIDWAYVSNPETLAEGSAVKDFSRPDRIIIGTNSDRAFKVMEELYYPFVRQQGIILRGSPADAELAKLFANTALATRVAMFDEFARIADATPGADMETIRRMVCSDARIGFMFSYPGAGYGGSCFPKDVQGVCAQACHDGFCPGVLGAVHKSNEDHKQYVAEKIVRLLSPGEKRVVSVWGVTFKPQTDDMRDAPSRVVVPYLVDSGIDMNVFEPKSEKARTVFGENPHIRFFEDQYSAVAGADALVLLTEWSQFDSPDFGKLKGIMRGRQLFDMRNRWQPSVANRHGFDYFGMGRNYPLKKGS